MASGLVSLLRRGIDLVCFMIAALAATAVVVVWRLRRRHWRAGCAFAAAPVMVSITADTIAETQRLNSRASVEVFYSRPLFARVIVLHAGRAGHQLVRLGRRVIGIDLTLPGVAALRDHLPLCGRLAGELAAVRATMALMRRVGSDYLEVMSPGPMIFQAMTIKSLTGCRLTTQVRGNVDLLTDALDRYYYCRLPRRWAPLRFLAGAIHHAISDGFHRRCDLVIGFNVNNMQSAIANGAAPEKTRLSRIEVADDIIPATPTPRDAIDGFPAGGKVVAIWARLDVGKRLPEAVDAFLLFARDHGGVTLLVIGDGPLRGELEAIAARHALQDRVRFVGYRPRSYIGAAAAYMDAAIVPYGGSSLVEAAMLGLPIIAFDIEWHSEMIRPGETGYLADYPDRAHMATLLAQALADAPAAREMAGRCRTLARRMFDRTNVDETMTRHMAALLALPRDPATG